MRRVSGITRAGLSVLIWLHQGVERVSNILANREYYLHPRMFVSCEYSFLTTFVRVRISAEAATNIRWRPYSRPRPYICSVHQATSKFPPFRRISVMQNSILGPPMVYITHISSKYSIFKTLRVNGSMNTCLILASIEYSWILVNFHEYLSSIFTANANIRIREYVLIPYLDNYYGSGSCPRLNSRVHAPRFQQRSFTISSSFCAFAASHLFLAI